MKNLTILFTVLLSMVGAKAMAHDIEVQNADGVTIYYVWTNNNSELAVSYKGSDYSVFLSGYSGNVVIPESVTYNGKIYSVTSIGEWAFWYCRSLTSVTIPNSVTSIGNSAFSDCRSLTSVTIPNSVTSIGGSAFYGCSLNSVTIPNSVTSIGTHAFADCSGLTSIKVDAGNTTYDSRENCNAIIGTSTNILIVGCKNTVIPKSVTAIGDEAFYGCSGLTSVTIPNSVTSIGKYAFYGCSGLTSVTIPNSVTSIGSGAFSYCSLTSITIPNSVTSIGGSVFDGTGWYDNQAYGLLYLDNWLLGYKGNKPTGNIVIQDGTKGIAGSTFYGCSGLTSITIPNSITFINNGAFYECSKLTSVTLPNSLTSIGDGAFYGCSGLNSVTIPNSVTSIGTYAFYGCSGLTSVTIPNSVTSIGKYAFYGCGGLTSVTIPNSVTYIENATFFNCNGLTSVTIPNSVTYIGKYAFYGCSGLTSVTIPNSVTSIGKYAFYGCSGLTSVTMGTGIKTIYESAFALCPELTDVYCYVENVPNTDNTAFKDSYIEYATLYVPESAIEQYRATAPWSQFGTKKTTNGDTPEPPQPERCATPTISYANGKLKFNCETEDVNYIYEITDSDIKIGYDTEVDLTVTYNITVYATKDGYQDSEIATATLCWIDVEPQTEGIIDEDAIAEVKAMPVLIQSQGSTITIQGATEDTPITIYDIEGKLYGTTIAEKNHTTISSSLRPGSVAIVKIGEKSVKVKL